MANKEELTIEELEIIKAELRHSSANVYYDALAAKVERIIEQERATPELIAYLYPDCVT